MKKKLPPISQSELRDIINEYRLAMNSGLLDSAKIAPVIETMESTFCEHFGETLNVPSGHTNSFTDGIVAALKSIK